MCAHPSSAVMGSNAGHAGSKRRPANKTLEAGAHFGRESSMLGMRFWLSGAQRSSEKDATSTGDSSCARKQMGTDIGTDFGKERLV